MGEEFFGINDDRWACLHNFDQVVVFLFVSNTFSDFTQDYPLLQTQ